MNDNYKEVQLSIRAINVLIKLNTEKRNDGCADRTFIKALLIAICTIKNIQQNIRIQDGIMEFMHGKCTFCKMFSIRFLK